MQEQGNSDSTLDDVACLLGCTRSSLHGELIDRIAHSFRAGGKLGNGVNLCLCGNDCCELLVVVASEKGVVVGRLSFREDGDLIDCQRMGVGGKAIPPNVDKVSQQA